MSKRRVLDQGGTVAPAGAAFDQNFPFTADDYAGQAGIDPKVAATLPLPVLKAISGRTSYAEGQIIPSAGSQDKGEPRYDPASRAGVDAMQKSLGVMETLRQMYPAESIYRGGRIKRKARKLHGRISDIVGNAAHKRLDRAGHGNRRRRALSTVR